MSAGKFIRALALGVGTYVLLAAMLWAAKAGEEGCFNSGHWTAAYSIRTNEIEFYVGRPAQDIADAWFAAGTPGVAAPAVWLLLVARLERRVEVAASDSLGCVIATGSFDATLWQKIEHRARGDPV